MKKILITLFLLFSLNIQQPKAHAVQMVMDFLTENATIISAAANLVSSAAESAFTASWFSEIALDIAANIAKHAAVKEMKADITSWATGGFQGDPTFVIRPETYFKNIAAESTRIQLAELTKNGGNLFSDTAVQSIVSDFRKEQLPINEMIPFTLGSTAQENICDDANLSEMAKKAVGGVLNGPSYTAKKAELANSLCSGDASKDKNTQQKLVDIYKSDFSGGGGWDSWLALTTGCQTEYCIAQKRAAVVAEKAAKEKELAESELKQGEGFLGIKECVKYSETKVTEDGIADCEEYETKTPAKLVADQTVEGLAGPEDAAEDSHGHRDFLATVMDNLITGVTSGLLNKGLASIGSGSGLGLVGNKSYSLTEGSINTVNQTNFAKVADVKPVDKTSLLKMIDDVSETIIKIDTVNASYLAYLENYIERLDNLNACYDSLQTINPSYSRIGEASSGKSWVASQRTEVLPIIELRKKNIDEYFGAKTLIARVKPIIRTSNNTEIVKAAMEEFTNGLTTDKVPHVGKDQILKADFEGRQRPMNYYLGQKESECSQMQSQASSELRVYNGL